MRITVAIPLFGLLFACGGDDGGGGGGGGQVDAPPSAPAMITISGTASKRMGVDETPAEGAMVAAFKNSDPNTPVATATTDAAGNYSLTIETGGVAVDGYVKATLAGFLDLYLYPPRPLAADYAGASLNIVSQQTLDILHAVCQSGGEDTAKGSIALIVADTADAPIAGAAVSSNPMQGKDCYNQGDFPNPMATMTQADGIGYLLNVTAGEATVNATKAGTTFVSHSVTVRAGAFTTTLVEP